MLASDDPAGGDDHVNDRSHGYGGDRAGDHVHAHGHAYDRAGDDHDAGDDDPVCAPELDRCRRSAGRSRHRS